MKTIVTFGEIMLRLSPAAHGRVLQAENFEARYAGAEANVAVLLALLGQNARFISKVPAHEVGQAAVCELRRWGVDTSGVVRGGDRLGVYYYENGAAQRAGKVIYDRAHSAIAEAALSDFDWPAILRGADWFHWTGITPALSANCAAISQAAIRAAKDAGVTTSCDLNYRSKLWTVAEARRTMKELVKGVDLMITNLPQVDDVLDIRPDDRTEVDYDFTPAAYEQVSREIARTYGCRYIAYTVRKSFSASHNAISAWLWDAKEETLIRSTEYQLHTIVDRVGGGDAFGAGLIDGLCGGKAPREALEFAMAAETLKHSIAGDFAILSREEIERLAGGDASGRVQR